MATFWNKTPNPSEWELMQDVEEVVEQPTAFIEEIEDEIADDIQEQSAYDLTDNDTIIVYNARLRLEQAKLYEMLINHNLFENVDADQQAIENVQAELKNYIVERLEILLGIRAPKPVIQQGELSIELPFNEVEVDFLKQLAYKGTSGQSVSAPAQVVSATPKSTGLNPLGSGKPASTIKPLAAPPKQAPVAVPPKQAPVATPQPKTQPKQAAKPTVKKTTKVHDKIISGTVQKRDLTPSEIKAIAEEEANKIMGKKPWEQMTPAEREREIDENRKKHVRPKSSHALPLNADSANMAVMQITVKREQEGGNSDSLINQAKTKLLNS